MSVFASQASAFSCNYKGITNVIKTDCTVYQAFDPKTQDQSSIPCEKCVAIWDTGATSTVIDRKLASKLRLHPITRAITHHANGSSEVNVYLVNIMLPNRVGVPNIRVTEANLGENADVLIGMDIIGLGDFSISNCNMETSFSFRIPSLEKVDFVDDANNKKRISQKPFVSPKKNWAK